MLQHNTVISDGSRTGATFTIYVSRWNAFVLLLYMLLEGTEKWSLQLFIRKIFLVHSAFNLSVRKYHAVSVTTTHGSYGNKVFRLAVSINFLLVCAVIYGNRWYYIYIHISVYLLLSNTRQVAIEREWGGGSGGARRSCRPARSETT